MRRHWPREDGTGQTTVSAMPGATQRVRDEMSFEIRAAAGRTQDFTVTLKTASAGYLQLASSDKVRFKMGRACGTPTLDILSGTATSNSSAVTIDERGDGEETHCSVTVRLAQADTTDLRGVYDAEISVVDDSETAPADAIKVAEKGTVCIEPSLGGSLGLS